MKKNNFTMVVFLIVGLVTGSIIAQLLAPVEMLSFLTKSAQFSWQPRANFDFIKYDFSIQVKLNLMSMIGLAAAFWIYRRI